MSFSDTICPSCAARVRLEGLWGISPPTPVWPGSPQTALVFVGLPLLTALVLLATPLHDAGPPPPREEAAAPLDAEPPATAPRVAEATSPPAAMPRAEARRQRVAAEGAVPAVIYEPRTRQHARPTTSGSAPAVLATRTSATRARSVPSAEPISFPSASPGADARATAASVAPQSP